MNEDKLQHEMYWNILALMSGVVIKTDKLQHEMYWNVSVIVIDTVANLINYNMRCIETI